MNIISQNTFFIKYRFVNVWKDQEDMTSSQESRANKNLRDFSHKLHKMPLDIGEGEQQYFWLVDYYKLISEIENPLKNLDLYHGKKDQRLFN